MSVFGFCVIFPFQKKKKKWPCTIYFSPGAKLAICLKKGERERERNERVHITFCTVLSVSLTKNIRSFTWANPVHLNVFFNLRAIYLNYFLPLLLQSCLTPNRRPVPHLYQTQYLLTKIVLPVSFI